MKSLILPLAKIHERQARKTVRLCLRLDWLSKRQFHVGEQFSILTYVNVVPTECIESGAVWKFVINHFTNALRV